MEAFLTIFERTTFLRFPKIFRRADNRSRTFSKNFQRFPTIAEDFRGIREYVLIMRQRI